MDWKTMLRKATEMQVKLDLQFFAVTGTYDAKKVTVIVGTNEITGFAEGSFVTAKPTAEAASLHVSAQGDAAIAITNNDSGEITFKLAQTSPANAYLRGIFKSRGLIPIWVVSNNSDGKEKVGGSKAILASLPEVAFSDKIEAREYKFIVTDYQHS